jgi:hypothetical protein
MNHALASESIVEVRLLNLVYIKSVAIMSTVFMSTVFMSTVIMSTVFMSTVIMSTIFMSTTTDCCFCSSSSLRLLYCFPLVLYIRFFVRLLLVHCFPFVSG